MYQPTNAASKLVRINPGRLLRTCPQELACNGCSGGLAGQQSVQERELARSPFPQDRHGTGGDAFEQLGISARESIPPQSGAGGE